MIIAFKGSDQDILIQAVAHSRAKSKGKLSKAEHAGNKSNGHLNNQLALGLPVLNKEIQKEERSDFISKRLDSVYDFLKTKYEQ